MPLTLPDGLIERVLDSEAPDGALVLATVEPGVLAMFEIARDMRDGKPQVAARYDGLMGAQLADGAELLVVPIGNFVDADDPEDGTPPTLSTRPPEPEEGP
jgi:hypothetical protein